MIDSSVYFIVCLFAAIGAFFCIFPFALNSLRRGWWQKTLRFIIGAVGIILTLTFIVSLLLGVTKYKQEAHDQREANRDFYEGRDLGL